MTILFIIESPGKVAKISKFLGSNYMVKASVGHFRDLDKKQMSIDFDNNFEPIYVVTKPDVVANLKAAMKKCDTVYIASDLDFEGEGIAESIYRTLRPKNYLRLRFNEITKKAILKAIESPGKIDTNLVNAQKTRRVLDRLYGYLISPILQKQLGGSGLSAGRVQSVAAEIVIDKENEINNFLKKNANSTFFKATGIFSGLKATLYEATTAPSTTTKTEIKGKISHIALTDTDEPHINVVTMLNNCIKSTFKVHSVSDKIATRSPAPPFTTSTLQQEANRKFGMPVDLTMKIAQKLYEGGFITYMRTDSVEISDDAHEEIKNIIIEEYGKEYYQKNVYKNKSKGAQAAHECIRPVHADLLTLDKELGDSAEEQSQIKLYKLIWQRTIASQMKPAKINVTTIQITISKYVESDIAPFYYFISQLEKIIFMGFMKVYTESVDDAAEDIVDKDFDGKMPKAGNILKMENITAKQEYLRPAPRYTEASLVKQLEKLNIGRPSTFVNTIKTIRDRKYVEITNIAGIKKDITTYTICAGDKTITDKKSTLLIGKENKKIVPTSLGITVNDFLIKHFPEMMDYQFTAKMEEELDDIANGDKIWHKVISKFYSKLKPIVDDLKKNISFVKSDDRLLGTDDDGNEIYAVQTRRGAAVKKVIDSKPYYCSIAPNELDIIKLKAAIKLLKYPIVLGQYEGTDVVLKKGETNFFIVCDKLTYSVDPDIAENINIKQAIAIIKDKKSSILAEYTVGDIKCVVFAGKFNPYMAVIRSTGRKNYPIPNTLDVTKLTQKQIKEIINGGVKGGVKGGPKCGVKYGAKGRPNSGSKTNTKSGSKTGTKTGSKTNIKKN